jgi:hypothetical protein
MRIYIILLLPLFFSCTSNKNNYYNGKDKMRGSVKSYSQTLFRATDKFGEPAKGSSEAKVVTTFDHKGNPLEISIFSYNGDLNRKSIYVYDENGLMKEMSVYRSSGSLDYRAVMIFDKNGNESKESQYSEDGELKNRIIFDYANYPQKVELINYNSEGRVTGKKEITFNEKGEDVEIDEYYSDGTLLSKHINSYRDADKHGNWQKVIVSENNKTIAIVEREYKY